MVKNNLISFFLGASILLLSCGNENAQDSKKYILSGKVSSLTVKELYLIDLLNQKAGPVDTAFVEEDGSFAFDYQPPMKAFYRVLFTQNFGMILPLSVEEEVKILGDANQFESMSIEGSDDAKRMKILNDFLQENMAQGQALEKEFQQYANSPKVDSILEVFKNRYRQIENNKVMQLKALIDEDPELFSNLAVVEQMPDSESDYYIKVDDALAPKYGNSPFFQSFHQKVTDIKRFAVGKEVPEINLPDPSGNLVPLTSLRGKVVLIDFWASWCKPCRRENPNVVAAYNKFKDKGFTIYGVSLDKSRDAWMNAIAQDGLNWTQVSDLKFWQSEAARSYGVSSIPFALLIDQNGKVLGKNLRGSALHEKLAEVLN